MPAATQLEPTLYEQDFDAWLRQQAQLARQGKSALLDLTNLAEELEDMSRRERRALESQLIRLLMHLLKWQYQASHRSGSWRLSIRDARRQLDRILQDSPSLRPYFNEIFERCYSEARGDAAAETELSPATFPAICPFTAEQVRDADYWPD